MLTLTGLSLDQPISFEALTAFARLHRAMCADELAPYYWTDSADAAPLDFLTKALKRCVAGLLHDGQRPLALCLVTLNDRHPETGESLEGQVHFYVMPKARKQASRYWKIFRQTVGKRLPLFALIHPEHRRCRVFARAMGFKRQGVRRQYATIRGVRVDMLRYEEVA